MNSSCKENKMKARPLSNKSFYLDLNGYKFTAKLTSDICKLGGTVEEFLSKDVRYLVTNKHEWKNFSFSCQSNTESSPYSLFQSPQSLSIGSPSAEKGCNEAQKIKSRGQSLLDKSRKSGQLKGSCDILQNANKFGTKILPIGYVIKWIHKKKQIMKNYGKNNENKQITNENTTSIRTLKVPFIKCESHGRLDRPFFKRFSNWPSLNFEDKPGSPFLFKKDAQKHTLNNDNVDEEENPKKQRSYFCEICSTFYHQIGEHLKTEKHAKFQSDPSKYKELDEFILNAFNPAICSESESKNEIILQKITNECKSKASNDRVNISTLPEEQKKTHLDSKDQDRESQLRIVLNDIGNFSNYRFNLKALNFFGIDNATDATVE